MPHTERGRRTNRRKRSSLTLGERRYLEWALEAESEGVFLRDHYSLAHGLGLRMSSRVQGRLTDMGLFRHRAARRRKLGEPGKLIEVRVAAAAEQVQRTVPEAGR